MESWKTFEKRFGPIVHGAGGRYTLYEELAVLLTLATRRQPCKILEMFTAYGHTACALAEACPEAQVHAFDVSKETGGYDVKSPYVGEVMSRAEVGSAIRSAPEAIRSRIQLTIDNGLRLASRIRGSAPYQFIYVDGDHTWARVLHDTRLALEVASDDAVIVWDDYWEACPDVKRFMQSLGVERGNSLAHVSGTRICYAVLDGNKRIELLAAVEEIGHQRCGGPT